MSVCWFACRKGEVVCVLGCMHVLSGLWGPETIQWREFPEDQPALTLLRRQSSPLPSKPGRHRATGRSSCPGCVQGSGQTEDGPWVWGWPAKERSRRGAPGEQMR